ncbi:hypothetical protein Pmani_036227 [Petrolisthes manimaculis]|uniref:Uncharacterized protein n=1 Tax=Petrolisthes manimaculis TaxID=1843537 RepID=A0AAE1NJ61_9EUCA|nr:hypothetical protein Pmani_036227 [Petrolisthes manimaculis]
MLVPATESGVASPSCSVADCLCRRSTMSLCHPSSPTHLTNYYYYYYHHWPYDDVEEESALASVPPTYHEYVPDFNEFLEGYGGPLPEHRLNPVLTTSTSSSTNPHGPPPPSTVPSASLPPVVPSTASSSSSATTTSPSNTSASTPHPTPTQSLQYLEEDRRRAWSRNGKKRTCVL